MPSQPTSPKPFRPDRNSLIFLGLLAALFVGYQVYTNALLQQEGPALTETAQVKTSRPPATLQPTTALPGISATASPRPAGSQASPSSSPSPGSAFQVWFSDPWSADAKKQVNGPDTPLIAAIQAARSSIDMAMYNLSLNSAADALIQAKNRGVKVRLVMESESIDNSATQKIQQAGIKIVGDRREGLMHNKFTIIDGQDVWTGSFNFTSASAYGDTNNLLRIRSTELAASYTNEFEQMFSKDRFGPDRKSSNPTPVLTIAGSKVEVYFSPGDGAAKHVNEVLGAAKKSIHILAYSFTSDTFTQTLIARGKAGVEVQGVFDSASYRTNIGGDFDTLKKGGLKVRLSGWEGLQHSKVMVVDGQVVITGSYNFTSSADRTNDENLLIITNPALAALYEAEFQKLYTKAAP